MSEDSGAPAAPAPAPTSYDAPSTSRGLADMLAEARSESAETATEPDEIPAQAENGDPQPEAPAEVPEAPEPAEMPPIEPPRSWTQAEKERFQSLPRETQEYLHTREQERDREVRRSQNETAEKLKGISAKEQQLEQARQQAEADVKAAREVLEREQRTRFPDIKSWDDYERLSAEALRLTEIDPFASLRISNYLKDFDTHQKSVQFNAQQAKAIEDQKAQDRQSKRAAYEASQNARLVELVPDMADPHKAAAKRESAVAMLTDDLGLKMEDLQRWMQDDIGHEILSNAGIQKLMDNNLTLKAIQAAKVAAAAKSVPPVQRPGTAKPPGSAQSETITKLSAKLESSGDHRDLGALLGAMRRA